MVMGSLREETEVVVIGSGPGGYVAALRLADLGKEVLLIESASAPAASACSRAASPRRR